MEKPDTRHHVQGVGENGMLLCASPAYLARKGNPGREYTMAEELARPLLSAVYRLKRAGVPVLLAYGGLRSEKLIAIQQKHTTAVKIGLGLLFVVLALVILMANGR